MGVHLWHFENISMQAEIYMFKKRANMLLLYCKEKTEVHFNLTIRMLLMLLKFKL
jgi:hypothetical protein